MTIEDHLIQKQTVINNLFKERDFAEGLLRQISAIAGIGTVFEYSVIAEFDGISETRSCWRSNGNLNIVVGDKSALKFGSEVRECTLAEYASCESAEE